MDPSEPLEALRRCPDCGATTTLSQPEIEQPDRLLGSCPTCGCWVILADAVRPGQGAGWDVEAVIFSQADSASRARVTA
jgi:ribosomal protein S27AE